MARKPEYYVNHIEEGVYISTVNNSIEKNTYIKCSISKEDIGNLLQGKSVSLVFLNDDYESTGMIDIVLSDGKTNFDVSDGINEMINKTK